MTNIFRSLIGKLKRKSAATHTAALMMTSTHLYLLIYLNGQKKPVHHKEIIKTTDTSWGECIEEILKNELLKTATLNIVLPGDQYQMLVVDKPDVEEAEIAAALKYSAKDYISGSLEEVVIEYFDIPTQIFGQNKINLIAAKKKFIEELIKIATKACHSIHRITVDELAYQDIFNNDEDASMLVVHHPKEELLMQIVKDGQLFFFRRIRGFTNLEQFAELEISHGASDSLSLEIQRSLDYFESQLRQAPVKRIYLAVSNPHQNLLIDKIGENFTIPVLPLKNRVADELPEIDVDQGFYPTVGAVKELLNGVDS